MKTDGGNEVAKEMCGDEGGNETSTPPAYFLAHRKLWAMQFEKDSQRPSCPCTPDETLNQICVQHCATEEWTTTKEHAKLLFIHVT